jgi:hypothetical protein
MLTRHQQLAAGPAALARRRAIAPPPPVAATGLVAAARPRRAAVGPAAPVARTLASPLLLPFHPRTSLCPPCPARGNRGGDNNNSSSSSSSSGGDNNDENNNQSLYSAGLLILWCCLLTYIFKLSPNQTPTLDSFVVLKLVGQKADDPYVVNPVFEAVFNIMGVYPAIFGALLVPGGRSGRRSEGPLGAALPAWPFVAAAFGLGAYALIPYMALWAPPSPEEAPELPPPPEETKGWSRLFLRGAETPVVPALLLAAASYWIFRAASSPASAWLEYVRQFDASRLVHATTVDFALCTALVPFWLSLDAEGRRWKGAGSGLATLLGFVPVVGPCVYLLLRPKSGDVEA